MKQKENTKQDLQFLQETLEAKLFPTTLNSEERDLFESLARQDIEGKLSVDTAEQDNHAGVSVEDKIVTVDEAVMVEADWSVMVATRTEFEVCLDFFLRNNSVVHVVEFGSTKLRGRLVEYRIKKGNSNITKKVLLQRTTEQGSNSSSNLIQKICRLKPNPRICMLVGSCGAIPSKKLRIGDVIVPTLAIDGTRVSVENGRVVPEGSSPFDRHQKIGNLLAGLTTSDFGMPRGCRVETDKQLITSIGKWDSTESDLVRALVDGEENVIAVEMEGVGMVDGLKTSQEADKSIILGISKGAADYCSTSELNDKQLRALNSSMPQIIGSSVKPTSDPDVKREIQSEAIERALQVALRIMQELD